MNSYRIPLFTSLSTCLVTLDQKHDDKDSEYNGKCHFLKKVQNNYSPGWPCLDLLQIRVIGPSVCIQLADNLQKVAFDWTMKYTYVYTFIIPTLIHDNKNWKSA